MTSDGAKVRQRRYARGLHAEAIAATYLMLLGHRILARRFKTPIGEIDAITLKNKRVGFVEIKRRATRGECEASITPRLRQRVRRAADLWLAKNPNYQGHDIGFDLVFVLPWQRPILMKDAL